MLTWEHSIVSMLYWVKRKKIWVKLLLCYILLHIPFLLERANYNYYSHVCVVSVFILIYSLNVCILGDGSSVNGLGLARAIVKVWRLHYANAKPFMECSQLIERAFCLLLLEIWSRHEPAIQWPGYVINLS